MNPEGSKNADNNNRLEKLLDCLQNPLDFEILMYFIVYKELTLSRLEQMVPHKSRPTVYRHIQNLLDAGIIIEAREEKVRGQILAKIYQISQDGLNVLPRITQEQVDKMTFAEKNQLYERIRDALYPTISFAENVLQRMNRYLQVLRTHPDRELYEVFEKQNFHLNLNFFSESQFKLFIKEYEKFIINFIPKMMELEEKEPDAERPYVFLMGLLPIHQIIDRLMEEKIE